MNSSTLQIIHKLTNIQLHVLYRPVAIRYGVVSFLLGGSGGMLPQRKFPFFGPIWCFSEARWQSFKWMNEYLPFLPIALYSSTGFGFPIRFAWKPHLSQVRLANRRLSFCSQPLCKFQLCSCVRGGVYGCPNVHQTMALMGNDRQFTSDGKSGSVETGLTRPEARPCYKGTNIHLVTCWYNESRLISCTIRTSVTINIHRKIILYIAYFSWCTAVYTSLGIVWMMTEHNLHLLWYLQSIQSEETSQQCIAALWLSQTQKCR